MGERECLVCKLAPETRAEVEQASHRGVSYRSLASQYGMSYKSVERHMKRHVNGHPVAVVPGKREVSFVEKFTELDGKIDAVIAQAEKGGASMLVLSALKEARGMLELRFRYGIEKLKMEEAKRGNAEDREADCILWLAENEPEVHARYLEHSQAARNGVT
jgi:hypothetical protein